MNERTLRLLEFETIRGRVADLCLSQEGRDRLLEAPILTDETELASLKATVQEYTLRLLSPQGEPSLCLPSIAPLFARLGKDGATLEIEEAYALGLFVESAIALSSWLTAEASRNKAPMLSSLCALLPDCSPVSREVFRVLDRNGQMRDLPELRDIRRSIQGLRRELESLGSRYTTDDEMKRLLQSDVPTQRDGRLVLAVKANYRSRIKGIVHEVSATGQTVYLEPEDLLEKNNEIRMAEHRLAAEIARILRELCQRVGSQRSELEVLHAGMLRLDGLRARARYGIETRGFFSSEVSEQKPLTLSRARHPLLGTKAVPIDVSLSRGCRMVIVTGPNTGGKTVALKTVGLFALMNQFGLALPSEQGTALPIFDGVFADIGDEQSISQSLSTFSAHMTNIASIIADSTARSLVLLDELGSGTDPEEGSAIALSLLDHFIALGSIVLTTTHHGILKNYGYTKEGVVNASVDFDANTLSPTYRILMGIPGESRALDIAGRNGLPGDIVQRARSYLDEERSDVSELIRSLKSRHQALDQDEQDRVKAEGLLHEKQRKVDLRDLKLRQKELELREQGLGQLNKLLGDSRKELENLVRVLREGELTREKTLAVKEYLSRLAATVSGEEKVFSEAREELSLQEHQDEATPSGLAIAEGVEVLAGPSRRRGKVLRAAKKGFWMVEIGTVRMTLAEKELVPVAPVEVKNTAVVIQTDLASREGPVLELNLRGFRLGDALETLEHQLNAAALSGLAEFSVIHGKGDGILQHGVHEYLKAHNLVADYYFSRPEEGGFGKTVVHLKR